MIELLFGIFETLLSLLVGLIEAIASLFTVGGEALGAGEAILVLAALLLEILFWVALCCVELVNSLIQWRKPKKVAKPIIWRPKKKKVEPKESAE